MKGLPKDTFLPYSGGRSHEECCSQDPIAISSLTHQIPLPWSILDVYSLSQLPQWSRCFPIKNHWSFVLKTESNEFQSSRIGPFEGEARHGSSGTGEDESVGTWECGWRWKELKCVEIATCARRVHSTSRTVHEGIQGSDRYCVGCDWYRWSEKKFVRNGKRDVIVCFWQRRESVWCLWFGFVVWMKCLRSLGRFWSCFVWFRWRVCWMCEE